MIFIFNTASRGIVIRRNSSSYSHLTIDNNGQITSSSMSTMPSNTMSVPTGHFKLDICAGIIMTNAQGECWKLYIDEAGSICTAEIPCP